MHDFIWIIGGAAGVPNLLWGGFLSCLTEFTVIGALWKHFSCMEPGCYRWAHIMADGHTRACWVHHPDGKPTKGHIQRAHDKHEARLEKNSVRVTEVHDA